jgi:hypothetical protein
MLATHLLQDLLAAYDASIHFVYENLASKLPRFAHLLAGDDLGMLLKQAQDLLGCRHLLIVEDAAGRLSDPSLNQRHEVFEALQKTPRYNIIGVLLQRFDDPSGLGTARLGDRDQLLVSLFELLTSFLPLAPGLVLCSR